MGKLVNFVTSLHKSTSRNYIQRMMNEKVKSMSEAKKYGKNYWDGNRKYGYGGYKYIPGRWKPIAEALIKTYKLGPQSIVLDVGCGKGFLLYEMKLLIPDLKVRGFDFSNYAIDRVPEKIKPNIFEHDIRDKFPFKNKEFDLVISLGTIHNLKVYDVKNALQEIERVGKSAYIMVESYRNHKELFNLQCWALTCESFFDTEEWAWLYKTSGFKGDYEFIFFE